MNFDFTPITNAAIYAKDSQYLEKSGKKWSLVIWGYVLLALTGIGLFIIILHIIKNLQKSNREVDERRQAMKDFAAKNGFSHEAVKMGVVTADDEITENLDLPYKPDRVSHLDVLRGKLLGYDFSYSVSFIQKKAKNGYASWPTVIFIVNLPVQLPKVFINSKFNNMPGLGAPVINFEQAEDHYLEGDFPKYYDVRIEKSQHIDMYTVLTPEVMDVLKRNNRYDVWLNGNQLVLLTFGDYARYFAGTPEAFANAETLMREIDKIARAIRRDSIAASTDVLQ